MCVVLMGEGEGLVRKSASASKRTQPNIPACLQKNVQTRGEFPPPSAHLHPRLHLLPPRSSQTLQEQSRRGLQAAQPPSSHSWGGGGRLTSPNAPPLSLRVFEKSRSLTQLAGGSCLHLPELQRKQDRSSEQVSMATRGQTPPRVPGRAEIREQSSNITVFPRTCHEDPGSRTLP